MTRVIISNGAILSNLFYVAWLTAQRVKCACGNKRRHSKIEGMIQLLAPWICKITKVLIYLKQVME